MAEFAANNNNSSSIQAFQFLVLRASHRRMSLHLVHLLETTTCKLINKKKAIDISEATQSIWKYAQKSIRKAQISLSNQCNKHGKNVSYDIRDKMW